MKQVLLLIVGTILPIQQSQPPPPLDASRGYMGVGSANPKVHCPFSQGESLVSLPGEMDEILSSVLCEDTGHTNVKVPGQVLSLASTPQL